jgi:hypothetical protein
MYGTYIKLLSERRAFNFNMCVAPTWDVEFRVLDIKYYTFKFRDYQVQKNELCLVSIIRCTVGEWNLLIYSHFLLQINQNLQTPTLDSYIQVSGTNVY